MNNDTVKYTHALKYNEYVCRIWGPQENDSGIHFKENEDFAYKYPAADPSFLKKLNNIFNTAFPLVTIFLKTLKLWAIIGRIIIIIQM